MKHLNSILMAIIIISSISLGYIFGNDKNSLPNLDKKINTENCNNLSLEDSAICLRDYVKTFYNYTVRDDTEKTLEDIKLNGGDCYDYSLLYEKLAKGLGFYSDTKSIFTENEGHKFAIIWNDNLTNYCTIDQLTVNCMELGFIVKNETKN